MNPLARAQKARYARDSNGQVSLACHPRQPDYAANSVTGMIPPP